MIMQTKEKVPVSFDSEYCVFEKVNDTYDSDKESTCSDFSDISEKNDSDKKYTEYIEELNNNYSFIKKKDKKINIKKQKNIEEESKSKQELTEEHYLSD